MGGPRCRAFLRFGGLVDEAGDNALTKTADGCRPDQLFGFWAIDETRFTKLLEVVQACDLETVRAETKAASAAAAGQPLYNVRSDGIARIDVNGPMTKYPTSFQSLTGGTATLKVREALRAAARDPEVSGIMLVVDSPGGTVAGTGDLFQEVEAADKRKPVYAYIEDQAASAGYWAAAGARRVYSNANAEVGSIGAFVRLLDTSGVYDKNAVKVHVVSSAPPHKGAMADGSPLSDEQKAEIQRRISDIADVFVNNALVRGRGMSAEKAQSLHTGQSWVAEKAQALGLIDGVLSYDEAVSRLRSEAMSDKDTKAAMELAEQAEKRANEEKAARVAVEAERDSLKARVTELEAKAAPPVDPMQALLASTAITADQRAALEKTMADAKEAERLRVESRAASFVEKAKTLGAGSKLPIKAEALGPILMRAEDNKLTVEDRGELERLLKAATAASVVGAEVGTSAAPTGDAHEKILALANELKAKDSKLTSAQAFTAVCDAHPELALELRAEQRKGA
jgi:signal peptide peptidase SppA